MDTFSDQKKDAREFLADDQNLIKTICGDNTLLVQWIKQACWSRVEVMSYLKRIETVAYMTHKSWPLPSDVVGALCDTETKPLHHSPLSNHLVQTTPNYHKRKAQETMETKIKSPSNLQMTKDSTKKATTTNSSANVSSLCAAKILRSSKSIDVKSISVETNSFHHCR